MERMLLFAGGLLTVLMTLFKLAMPYLFHWQAAMGSSPAGMWSILFAENLGISLVLLFFSCMSIFQWRELLMTGLGKTVLLCMGALWIFRTAAEILIFKIGVDGAWWRVFLFLALAAVYLIPLVSTGPASRKPRF